MCLTQDGQVYAWGGTLYKKVGVNATLNNEPCLVTSLQGNVVIAIDCGDFHSVALDQNGKLFTWGGGGAFYNKGQCGHGNNEDVEFPKQVMALSRKKIAKVSAGGFHTLALCDDGELFAWGNGVHGECGIGDSIEVNNPRLVKFQSDSAQ